jgi:DNA mismatch repair protein MutS
MSYNQTLDTTEVSRKPSIPTSLEDQTPLMRQYWELKSKVPDSLLFFRMGDFYELFGDDAVTAANLLEITLTSRDKNRPNPMPMAGVPHHSVQAYIQKLLKAGKKIAIGEQMEDPEAPSSGRSGAKIVRREITRILTPAVQFDAEGSEPNYLATLSKQDQKLWILSCLDVSTGEALVSHALDTESIGHEIRRLPIRHFLQSDPSLEIETLGLPDSVLIESLPKNYISPERAAEVLKKHYDLDQLQVFIQSSAGILGLGILVTYTLRTQQLEKLDHLRLPEPLQKPKSLVLGPSTYQHLDLPELFDLINQTRSTLGARQLKRWLTSPLCDAHEIGLRQKAVQELAKNWSGKGEKISAQLSQVYDLERICGRVNTKLANPRDTLALGQSLSILKSLASFLTEFTSPLLSDLRSKFSELYEKLGPLSERILTQQKEEAPLTSKDAGIFKTGTTPDLDRLILLTEDGQRWLIELETREREKTGIPSLKVRYNRVFGYYIEITQAHLKNVPSHYQRKQTMVGAERFFTEELKRFEEDILTASVKQKALEHELFTFLISDIQEATAAVMEAARVFGELDALCSHTRLTQFPNWCFPIVDESLDLEIKAGRHPVVDQAKRGRFIPNDISLSVESRMTLLITGPNMGGKSTVMRQTALIVILGQMGAPVPATQARWGTVSSLYTRIGAQDAIAKGQSTFMVEMSELAHILHHADERSLMILDEIGRGTSTYDGISVAWSTLEWICNRIRSRTLFATHYHELIRLATTLPLLANAHMAVENSKGNSQGSLRFLYELREGPTNESFGIHVAKLAGLPKPVIDRAWKVLQELESHSAQNSDTKSLNQLSLFDQSFAPAEEEAKELPPAEPHPVMQELQTVNINEMTPIQALNFVLKLQDLAANG